MVKKRDKILTISSGVGLLGGIVLLSNGASNSDVQLSPGEVAINGSLLAGGVLIAVGIVSVWLWAKNQEAKKTGKIERTKVKKKRKSRKKVKKRR